MSTTKTNRRAKAKSNGSGVTIPNALSKQDKIKAIAETLIGMQQEELNLEMSQVTNDHADSEAVPGLGVNAETGQPMTYAERKAILRAGQVRLAERHRDLMAAVQSFINGFHARQEQQQG